MSTTVKDYSHLNKKTLFIHRIRMQDEGKVHEYFFGTLKATKSTVTAYIEVTHNSAKCYVFDPWFVDLFKENTASEEFEIRGKTFVPDYTVHHRVDLRTKTRAT